MASSVQGCLSVQLWFGQLQVGDGVSCLLHGAGGLSLQPVLAVAPGEFLPQLRRGRAPAPPPPPPPPPPAHFQAPLSVYPWWPSGTSLLKPV